MFSWRVRLSAVFAVLVQLFSRRVRFVVVFAVLAYLSYLYICVSIYLYEILPYPARLRRLCTIVHSTQGFNQHGCWDALRNGKSLFSAAEAPRAKHSSACTWHTSIPTGCIYWIGVLLYRSLGMAGASKDSDCTRHTSIPAASARCISSFGVLLYRNPGMAGTGMSRRYTGCSPASS